MNTSPMWQALSTSWRGSPRSWPPRARYRLRALYCLLPTAYCLLFYGCTPPGGGGGREVVVYTALDREFSEPLLRAYGARTGVRVVPKFDIESTKTVGLTQSII